jgi:hypothetical protein
LILLVAGIAGLAVGTFQYTRKRDVVNVGPIHVQTREKETFVVPPLAAGGVAALGLVLVLAGGRKQ